MSVRIDQTVHLFDNRKLFFDPILDATPAATPAPVLASLLGDTAHLSKPTDLQTAGRIIHNTEQAVSVLVVGHTGLFRPKQSCA